jgi:hypothetical protein
MTGITRTGIAITLIVYIVQATFMLAPHIKCGASLEERIAILSSKNTTSRKVSGNR